jgi:hypothetical protein
MDALSSLPRHPAAIGQGEDEVDACFCWTNPASLSAVAPDKAALPRRGRGARDWLWFGRLYSNPAPLSISLSPSNVG